MEYQAEAAAWLDKIVPLVGSLAAAPAAAATGTGNASLQVFLDGVYQWSETVSFH